MAMTNRIRKERIFPASTVGQWLLAPALAAMVFASWTEHRLFWPAILESTELIAFGAKRPLVAIKKDSVIRVIDTETRREIYRGQLSHPDTGLDRDEARFQVPEPFTRDSCWDGLVWPAFETPPIPSERYRDEFLFQFVGDDEVLIAEHFGEDEENQLAIIHLPTGRKWERSLEDTTYWHNVQFRMAGRFLLAVSEQSLPAQREASSIERVFGVFGFDARDFRFVRLLAIDPATGEENISDVELATALVAHHREDQAKQKADDGELFEDCSIFQSSANPEGYDFHIEVTQHTYHRAWRTSKNTGVLSLHDDDEATVSLDNRYWLVDEARQRIRPASWPFAVASIFSTSKRSDDQPAVCGELTRPWSNGMGCAAMEKVYWNLETGKTARLEEIPLQFRQYGNRVVVQNENSVEVIDLASGSRSRLLKFRESAKANRIWLFGGWIVVWMGLVRPSRAGDFSRRLGIVAAILAYAAISAMNWEGAIDVYYRLPTVEWISLGVILLTLLGCVAGSTIWRSASPATLCVVWPLALLMLGGFVAEGERPRVAGAYDPLGSRQLMSPLRFDAWTRATEPNQLAWPASTPLRPPTTWENLRDLFSPNCAAPPIEVSRVPDPEETTSDGED